MMAFMKMVYTCNVQEVVPGSKRMISQINCILHSAFRLLSEVIQGRLLSLEPGINLKQYRSELAITNTYEFMKE